MREIKFKAKRVDNDQWVVGDLASNLYVKHETKERVCAIILMPENGDCDEDLEFIDAHPETVCQFIGLKDKNGTDIYEGDIVKWDDCSNGKYWRIAVVEIDPDIQFNCLPFQEYKGIKNSSNHCFNYGNFAYKKTGNYLEIIGNINDKN